VRRPLAPPPRQLGERAAVWATRIRAGVAAEPDRLFYVLRHWIFPAAPAPWQRRRPPPRARRARRPCEKRRRLSRISMHEQGAPNKDQVSAAALLVEPAIVLAPSAALRPHAALTNTNPRVGTLRNPSRARFYSLFLPLATWAVFSPRSPAEATSATHAPTCLMQRSTLRVREYCLTWSWWRRRGGWEAGRINVREGCHPRNSTRVEHIRFRHVFRRNPWP